MKPMNRLGEMGKIRRHPDKSGRCLKNRNNRIETTPCFSMVRDNIQSTSYNCFSSFEGSVKSFMKKVLEKGKTSSL
jgi:hypothetical protein